VTLIVPSRRGFIGAAMSLLAAPAIVRSTSLMPVKVVDALSIADAAAAKKYFGDPVTTVYSTELPLWYRQYIESALRIGFEITRTEIRPYSGRIV